MLEQATKRLTKNNDEKSAWAVVWESIRGRPMWRSHSLSFLLITSHACRAGNISHKGKKKKEKETRKWETRGRQTQKKESGMVDQSKGLCGFFPSPPLAMATKQAMAIDTSIPHVQCLSIGRHFELNHLFYNYFTFQSSLNVQLHVCLSVGTALTSSESTEKYWGISWYTYDVTKCLEIPAPRCCYPPFNSNSWVTKINKNK